MNEAPTTHIRWTVAVATLIGIGLLIWWGLSRLQIDTNLFHVLPRGEPILDEAAYQFEHHPGLDRIAIDLRLEGDAVDRDRLVEAGDRLEAALVRSEMFRKVGTGHIAAGVTRLLSDAATHLPVSFDREELEEAVGGAVTPKALSVAVDDFIKKMSGLGGIGQAEILTADPLDLRAGMLARVKSLLPSGEARLYRGHLLSGDGRHLLVVAEPKGSSGDTGFARRLDETIRSTLAGLDEADGPRILAAPVGAYRAALDNETTIRRDVKQALLFSGGLIVLLLLVFFPRPWLGLLALVPAIAGTAAGLALYSVLESSISLLALGFGGAVVSITVDHGIAYLLFLDRRSGATGKEASREVWSLALLAVLTTVGAFLSLRWSGFPVLEQLGLFAALGVACSFLFVHTVSPWIFKSLGPVRRRRRVDVDRITAFITRRGGWIGVGLAAVLFVAFIPLARPGFRVDLHAMNSVSDETMAAEELVTQTWGDVLGRMSILVEGRDLAELQARADALGTFIEESVRRDVLADGFSLSFLYPGAERARANLSAWREFWTDEQVERLRSGLATASEAAGLASDAFAPFVEAAAARSWSAPKIDPALYPLLGITETKDGGLLAMASVTPGLKYDAGAFFERATALPGVSVLDPDLFGERLSEILFDTFARMLGIVGVGVAALLLIFFLELVLPLLVLAPVVFSMVCTLGTLRLLGRPLDISSLLLAVVVVGMGIDYGVFFIRSYQRYRDEAAQEFGPIRNAVFLAWLSTLAGFGALALSGHPLLANAGLTGALAIAYVGFGSFVLLPPLMRYVYRERSPAAGAVVAGSAAHEAATLWRYRLMEPYPRQFARIKLRLDPMFPRLAEHLHPGDRILDVGCGYGIPGSWILALDPDAQMYGVEPDQERVRVTGLAWGSRGVVVQGGAPGLPKQPERVDLAVMLDIIHHLTDSELATTLRDLRQRVGSTGRLLVRVTVPSGKSMPWERLMERIRFGLLRIGRPRFRTLEQLHAIFAEAGFQVDESEPTAPGREETWLVASGATGAGGVDP
jgi:uncharacterized protein